MRFIHNFYIDVYLVVDVTHVMLEKGEIIELEFLLHYKRKEEKDLTLVEDSLLYDLLWDIVKEEVENRI